MEAVGRLASDSFALTDMRPLMTLKTVSHSSCVQGDKILCTYIGM